MFTPTAEMRALCAVRMRERAPPPPFTHDSRSFNYLPLAASYRLVTFWECSHLSEVTWVFFPCFSFSESSEEESTGEREEEAGAHDAARKAAEFPAEESSDTHTGEC